MKTNPGGALKAKVLNQRIRQSLKAVMLLAVVALMGIAAHAQTTDPDGPPTGPGGGPGDPDNSVPVDGGISLLLAGGIAYGVKKKRDERKKAAEAERKNRELLNK